MTLYDIYRENQVPGRRCKLLKDMERIFDETHNAGCGECTCNS